MTFVEALHNNKLSTIRCKTGAEDRIVNYIEFFIPDDSINSLIALTEEELNSEGWEVLIKINDDDDTKSTWVCDVHSIPVHGGRK